MTSGKSSLILLIMILFLAACSSGGASDHPTKTTAAPPTGEEILEQSISSMTDVPSFRMEKTEELNMESTTGYSQSTSESGWMIIETEPFAMHSRSVKDGEENLMYIKDNYSYLHNPLKQTWNKADIASDETASKNAELLKEPFKIQAEQMTNIADDIEVTENDNNYVLKATADASKAESVLEMISGISNARLEENTQTEFENFEYTISVDKDTQLPQHLMMDIAIKITDGAESTTVSIFSDVSYSDYGATEKIALSEDAANARDVTEERKTWY
ncbi:DUF6612 family protein [Terribacillus saccharophilus]|uniref:DUF6612 family protein n=1 Tax=Terribacillus saccharophilus TaxID=361277 RepID=UPI0039821410